MSQNVIQTAFTSGELAPSLLARTDLAKYHSGAATMRNFFPDYRSGASTRPGTRFVSQARNSSKAVRLIPFQNSTTTTFILEFGDHYIRFINNGSMVLETGIAITAATNALPCVIRVPGNNFAVGDVIFLSNIGGMTQLNGRYFSVSNVAGDFITLNTQSQVPVDSRNYGAYTSGGTASRVYTISSPYAAEDLQLLKFAQSPTIMTLVHPLYPPYHLAITTATNWQLVQVTYGSTVLPPLGLAGSTIVAGPANYAYVVTSVDVNGQESSASGIAQVVLAGNFNTTQLTITLTWIAAVGAVAYNVYKAEMNLTSGVPVGVAYGFIGTTRSNVFIDTNIQPDFTTSPPLVENPFILNNPGVFNYHQQRAVYAASLPFPQTFWMSQPGLFENFNVSDPTQPDDAITGTIFSNQVNYIKSLVSMPGGLIAFTSSGAWQISGGGGGGVGSNTPITATNVVAVPQAYNGASDVMPIVSNFDILFVQAKGSAVRDLSYNLYAQIYTGTDISIMSNHLFFNYQILYWAWAEEPFKVVWTIRNDGTLLSLTYVKEQEIAGWARHDTKGNFESVATVTEGNTDAVYFVVKRLIGGQFVRYIERFMGRTDFTYGAEDTWAVDCGVQSTLTFPNATLFAQAASGNGVTITADQPVFSVGSVGSILRIGGGIAKIVTFISTTVVLVNFTSAIVQLTPDDPTNTPAPSTPSNWSISVPSTVFGGLDFLEGQQVSILADGGVVTPQVVVNGTITLPQPATKVTVGLGFVAQLQTMYLDTGEPTIQGKRKKIAALT